MCFCCFQSQQDRVHQGQIPDAGVCPSDALSRGWQCNRKRPQQGEEYLVFVLSPLHLPTFVRCSTTLSHVNNCETKGSVVKWSQMFVFCTAQVVLTLISDYFIEISEMAWPIYRFIIHCCCDSLPLTFSLTGHARTRLSNSIVWPQLPLFHTLLGFELWILYYSLRIVELQAGIVIYKEKSVCSLLQGRYKNQFLFHARMFVFNTPIKVYCGICAPVKISSWCIP